MHSNFYYSQFAQDVRNVQELVENINKTIDDINKDIDLNEVDKSIKKSFELNSLCEKLTLSSRLIPMAFPTDNERKKETVRNAIIKEIDMKCSYIENDWLYVKMPCLLPKKKKRENANYIRESLAITLNEYFMINTLKNFKKDAVLIFKHNYSKERTSREYRDHDNIEIKSIIDIITCYSLIDDTAMCCKHFYCSEIQDVDSTEIFVIPNEDFILWLRKYGGYNGKTEKVQ